VDRYLQGSDLSSSSGIFTSIGGWMMSRDA
jgi:hypothetical protein